MADVGETLAQLTRRAGQRLVAFGFILTGSQSDAEELVQEAIVKTLVRRPRLDDASAAEQYVRVAMRTLAIDRSRKQKRFRDYAAANPPVEHAPGRDVVQAISDQVAVQRALAGLTDRQRIAVALRYWDDMTVGEVGRAMHIATGTVKRYLHDAAEVLRPLLGEHDEDEDTAAIPIVDESRKGRRQR